MNSCNLIGRLGANAELRYTNSGTAVANFSMAVDRIGKDKDGEKRKPLWLKVIVWAKQAETLTPMLTKGRRVGVTGELDVREWEDREGAKRTSVEITARQITLLGGEKRASSEGSNEPPVSDDDIPF